MRIKLLIGLAAVVASFFAAATATAALNPETHSQPYQAVCEAQGGSIYVGPGSMPLQCVKASPDLITPAWTEKQVDLLRTICERVYGGRLVFETPFGPGPEFLTCAAT